MLRKIATLTLLLVLSIPAWAGYDVVHIFRIQPDLPNPGDEYNLLQDVNFQGTVFFSNAATEELHDVKVLVRLYDNHRHLYGASRTYTVGTVGAGEIVNQNYRIPTATDVYLIPVVTVTYTLNGVAGEAHTRPQDLY